jgi:hypothetical protein
MLEIGAALAHRKEMIPGLVYVSVTDLIDPLRGFQARTIETEKQKAEFVHELANMSLRFERGAPSKCTVNNE